MGTSDHLQTTAVLDLALNSKNMDVGSLTLNMNPDHNTTLGTFSSSVTAKVLELTAKITNEGSYRGWRTFPVKLLVRFQNWERFQYWIDKHR